jgi:hypothetical protein
MLVRGLLASMQAALRKNLPRRTNLPDVESVRNEQLRSPSGGATRGCTASEGTTSVASTEPPAEVEVRYWPHFFPLLL